jgi:predicted aspartyl protease
MNQRGIQYVFILVCSLSILLQPQQSHAQTQIIGYVMEEPLGYVEIPFETHNNLIIIPVTINGFMTLRFILDTGIRNTVITEKRLADFIGIKYSRKVPIIGADGSQVINAFVADDVSTNIGKIKGYRQSILVLEEDFLQLNNYIGTDIHGIIGYDLFDRFTIDINYDQRKITFYEPDKFKPKRFFKPVKLDVRDTKPYMAAKVVQPDGSSLDVDLLIDTGASLAISLDQASNSVIYIPQKNVRASLGRGLGGEIDGYISRISLLQFERFKFKEVLSSYPEENVYSDLIRGSGRNGSIGGNVLKRLHVVFDYRNQLMYVRKGREYKSPFEYNMAGIELVAVGVNYKTLVVDNIIRNSVAEREDFRIGDIILAINNVPIENLNLNLVNAFFRQRAGKTLKIKIKRDNETLLKKIKLERII